MKRLSIIFITLFLAMVLLNCESSQEKNATVTFADSNLERVIRETIDKQEGEIYKSDLSKIIELSADGEGITDLSGIEDCINLKELQLGESLSCNDITDISPLSNLIHLQRLDLSCNDITDISPLSNLSNLKDLTLRDNDIADVSVLSNLTEIENLNISNNSITEIGKLQNVSILDLSHNQIVDITNLSSLKKVEILRLNDNRIKEITSLSNLSSIEGLSLDENDISDIGPLSKLSNLNWLSLTKNGMTIDFNTPNTNGKVVIYHIENGCGVTFEEGNNVIGSP
jgi:internalin A